MDDAATGASAVAEFVAPCPSALLRRSITCSGVAVERIVPALVSTLLWKFCERV